MSYKVNYITLAKMDDERIGNIQQSSGYFFTDLKINGVPTRHWCVAVKKIS